MSVLATAGAVAETPTPKRIGYAPIKVPNACLPDAAGFQSAYAVYVRRRATPGWSRLLLVYKTENATVRSHAFCLFSLEGKLWAYDQVTGSQRALIDPADKNDAIKVGRTLSARGFVGAAWVDRVL